MEHYTTEQVTQLSQQAAELAKQHFKTGLNCAEAVLKAFLDVKLTEISPDVLALSSGFGGGIGMTKHTCGAVSGAVMAVGALRGRKDPLAKETLTERIRELQEEIYPVFRAMVEEFQAQYGSVTCSQLSAPHGDFEGKERKRSCMQMITYAASLAVRYALS